MLRDIVIITVVTLAASPIVLAVASIMAVMLRDRAEHRRTHREQQWLTDWDRGEEP